MNRLKKMYSVIAVAVFALGMIVVPAQAASGPAAAGVCTGVATVDPGLHLPPDSKTFTWTLETECTVVSSDGVETLHLSASGTGTGACGLSTASGGSGTLSSSTQTVTLSNIGWVSAGSMLLVSGNHDTPGTTGSFQAQVNAQGGPACLDDGGATAFTVTVVGEFI